MADSPNFISLGNFVQKHKRKIPLAAAAALVLFFVFGYFFVANQQAQGATIYWDGGGGDNNWSTAANWTGDILPGASDTARFDGAYSNKDVTIDVAINVRGVYMNSNYTGEITQANTITVGESNWIQLGGTFTGATQDITFTSQLTLYGGTFTSTSGTLTIQEDFNYNITTIYGLGTFLHNNGTVVFSPESTTGDYLYNGPTFYDLEVNSTIDDLRAIRLNGADTVVVENSLTLTNGEIDSVSSSDYIQLDGTLSIASTFDGGTGIIELVNDVDLVGSDGDVYPGFRFTHASSSYIGPGAGTNVIFEGPLDVASGTVTLGDGDHTIGGLDTTGSGTFSAGNGKITSEGGTWDVDGTITFNDFEKTTTASMTIASGDTVIVSGDIALTDGEIDTGTLRATGTISSVATSFDGGTGTFDVQCACSISQGGGAMMGLNLNNAGASYTATGNVGFEGDLVLTSGTFNAGAGTLSFRSAGQSGAQQTLNNIGGTFNHDNGTLSFYDIASGGDFAAWAVDGDWDFYDLYFQNDYSMTMELNALNSYSANSIDILNISRGGTKVYLQSDTPGTAVDLDFATDSEVVDSGFTDINNSGPGTVTCLHRCIDGGNNTGFDIGFKDITVSEVSDLTVSETGTTSTFTVRLDRVPASNVTVTPFSSDTGEATVSGAMVFTPSNYWTEQTVTITGVADGVDDDEQEVTVTMSVTSGDIDYDGYAMPERTVKVYDEDTDAYTIDFDSASGFSSRDVKNTGSANITYFEYWYYGFGYFEVSSGGATVDITGSDIQPGCHVDIDGTIYQITSIDDASSGYVAIDTVPPGDTQIDYEDNPIEGTVNSITCTGDHTGENRGGLSSGLIPSVTIAGGGIAWEGIIYDSVNDKIMGSSWSGMGFTDATTGVQTSLAASFGGNGGEWNPAYDPTRGYTWWPYVSGDSIVAFDGATNGFAFGTSGASTFSVGDQPTAAVYDSTQDAIWVTSNRSTATVYVLDASDGSTLFTLDFSGLTLGSYSMMDINYDPVENAIWLTVDDDDTGVSDRPALIKLDATDGTPYDTDLATSTYDSHQYWHYFTSPDTAIDTSLGEIYVSSSQCEYVQIDDTAGDYLSVLDRNGEVVDHIKINSSCWYGMTHDEANDRMIMQDNTGRNIFLVDLASRDSVRYTAPNEYTSGMAMDAQGDLWVTGSWNDALYELVFDGVPTDSYYTSMTTDASQMDVSTETSLSSVTVNEDLDGGEIYYALSFDDGSNKRGRWVVWNSPARVICSNDDADHGGVDGNYYWRDNADTWTAVPSNTAEECVALAVEAGANNQMDGTELAALDSTSLEDTDGFEAGVTTTLDLAATFYSTDAHDSPTVSGVTFGFGAGGGGGGGSAGGAEIVSPSETDIEVLVDQKEPGKLEVLLKANNAEDYILSEDPNFQDTTWKTYTPNIFDDPDQDKMQLSYTCSGAGQKSLYVKYRSITHNTSITKKATFEVDSSCKVLSIGEVEIVPTPLSNEDVWVSPDDELVPDLPKSTVFVIEGSDISEYIMSETPDFSGASWQAFMGESTGEMGSNDKLIYQQKIPYTFLGDEDVETMYIRLRSPSGDFSDTFAFKFSYDSEGTVLSYSEELLKTPSDPNVGINITSSKDGTLGLDLEGVGLYEYRLSLDPAFANTTWATYSGSSTGETGSTGLEVQKMQVAYDVSERILQNTIEELTPDGNVVGNTAEESIEILTIQSEAGYVDAVLQGQNISEYQISEDPYFANATWKTFSSNIPDKITEDGTAIQQMRVSYPCSEGTGEKSLYVKYRSPTYRKSHVLRVQYTANDSCQVTSLTAPSPISSPPQNVVLDLDPDNPSAPDDPLGTVFILDGTDIEDYAISEDPTFGDTTWTDFVDTPTGTTGENGEEILRTYIPYALSSTETTVYVRVRSISGEQSDTLVYKITSSESGDVKSISLESTNASDPGIEEQDSVLDPEVALVFSIYAQMRDVAADETAVYPIQVAYNEFGELIQIAEVSKVEEESYVRGCLEIFKRAPDSNELEKYMFGVAVPGKSTPDGLVSTTDEVQPGDFIRATSTELDTVYCVTADMRRRPFMDEVTFFTHTRSFEDTRWVTPETLEDLPLIDPVLPNPKVALVKFESVPNVYIHSPHPTNSSRGQLTWISTEELAIYMFGENWADYVIDLNPTLAEQFDELAPLLQPTDVESELLRRRELLNENNAEITIASTDERRGFFHRLRNALKTLFN